MNIFKSAINFLTQFSLKKHVAKNQGLGKNEYLVSNFLPYGLYYDNDTMLLSNGFLMKTIRLTGYSFETADDDDIDIRKEIRNQFVRGLPEKIKLYTHIIRYKNKIFNDDFATKPSGIYFVDYVNMVFKNKFAMNENYVNELYISILIKTGTSGLKHLEKLKYLINPGKLRDQEKQRKEEMRETLDELDEAVNRFKVSLRDYSPKVLKLYKNKSGFVNSEINEFLSLIGNFEKMPVSAGVHKASDDIFRSRLYFKRKHFEIVGAYNKRYGGITSLKEYGQNTHAGFLDAFLQLPCEIVITQTYDTANRQVAIGKMQLQQNRMVQAEDKAISQVVEITRALDDAMSGKIGFGFHHLTIMCIERSVKSLEHAMSMVEVELMNTGVYVSREKWNMEPAYWAQFPGNFDFIVRRAIINSKNFAGMNSFHNYPLGKRDKNHWGEAVTILNTTSKTPFYFNFHVRDIGHTVIIGPTGAGKTVLMNFLCCQVMKCNPKMFFFDKDRGAEIFLRAIGGKHTIIEARSAAGFNPFHLDDNAENRTFLTEWIKQLITVVDDKITPDDVSKIAAAVDGNFKLERKDRVLSNVVAFLGMNTPGSLANRVEMWHGYGSHAALFDNTEDTLDLTKFRVYGFEMAEILKDPIALPVVLNYLFHRISISLNGEPTMIVLDEAWALIDNPVFGPKIKDWLKVLRKLNAMVIFATQSVEDVGKSAISDTLIQQTATQIFLPNLKATSIYRTLFMLSQREFNLIKSTDPSSRYFLIKQNMDAVIAKLDLSGAENVVSVLSGRADTVLLLDGIRARVGDEPEKWLPIFFKEVANV